MKSFLVFIFILFNLSNLFSQDTIRSLKQVITHYSNGKIKTIENFIADSCKMFNVNTGEKIVVDTCRYGFFKEYYPNGILKIIGQYDCEILDTIRNKKTNNILYFEMSCYKKGIWQEFDSLGTLRKTIYGDNYFYKYPFKQDTLIANKDSIIFKLKPYEEINSYLIKKNHKNYHIFLDLPTHSDHNYWFLIDKKLDISQIMLRKIDTKEFFTLIYTKQDDLLRSNQRYMDISHLKSGRYYLYYRFSIYPPKYELEIIIKDISD